MKKKLLGCTAMLLLAKMVGTASAASYTFDDMIDKWGLFNVDAAWIGQNHPLSYIHNINDSVNFGAGDFVTAAELQLDFTNDLTDFVGTIIIPLDFREYATIGFDGANWVNIGEVGNGQYTIILNIDWLNDNGLLDVTLSVSNPLGTATAWLDHSYLSGTAETAPVPEPTTMLLLGTGLLGLVSAKQRKKA